MHDANLPHDSAFVFTCAARHRQVLEGLQPAGQTLLTNEKTPPPIPKGTYDYGSGFYDPQTEQIMSYDGKEVLGYATELEEPTALGVSNPHS